MPSKTLSDLNACSRDDFVAALGNVFEYSPWIAEHAALARPFDGLRKLFDAMKGVVNQTAPEQKLALIRAHPDLANKTQRAAGLTAESSAEQNSAGLDRLSDAEFDAFERANSAYRTRFGFPYIVCARRRTKGRSRQFCEIREIGRPGSHGEDNRLCEVAIREPSAADRRSRGCSDNQYPEPSRPQIDCEDAHGITVRTPASGRIPQVNVGAMDNIRRFPIIEHQAQRKALLSQSAFIRIPSFARSSLNTTAMASIMSLSGFTLQYWITSCSMTFPLRKSR